MIGHTDIHQYSTIAAINLTQLNSDQTQLSGRQKYFIYLVIGCLMSKTMDLSLLVINSLNRDLKELEVPSAIIGALTCLCTVQSEPMIHSLLPALEELLSHPVYGFLRNLCMKKTQLHKISPQIRKKAFQAYYKFFKFSKTPIENPWLRNFKKILIDPDPEVMSSCIIAFSELATSESTVCIHIIFEILHINNKF